MNNQTSAKPGGRTFHIRYQHEAGDPILDREGELELADPPTILTLRIIAAGHHRESVRCPIRGNRFSGHAHGMDFEGTFELSDTKPAKITCHELQRHRDSAGHTDPNDTGSFTGTNEW